jgi:hypothetical protein
MNSALLFEGSAIEDCVATSGGGISSVNSALFLCDATFHECKAWANGGAIAMILGDDGFGAFSGLNCLFRGCSALTSGGALSILGSQAIFVEDARFEVCTSATAGGAIRVLNSDSTFARCLFSNNSCATSEVGSGGGSIWFGISDSGSLFRLETHDCCFVGDNIGVCDVYVKGKISWESVHDRFLRRRVVAIGNDDPTAALSFENTSFLGDANFFKDFALCALPNGVAVGNLQALVRGEPAPAPALLLEDPPPMSFIHTGVEARPGRALGVTKYENEVIRPGHESDTRFHNWSVVKVLGSSFTNMSAIPGWKVLDAFGGGTLR